MKLLRFLILSGMIFLAVPAAALTEQALLEGLSQAEAQAPPGGEEQKLFSSLQKGLGFYGSLKDYKAVFHKAESSDGKPGENEKIYLKFEKPWKIYMGWLNTSKKGLQVVYERGKNDGKLAIHKPGLFLGLMPVIFLDQNSPWVREGSASYNIEDAGLGTFLTDFSRAVLRASKENKLKVVSKGPAQEADLTGEKMEVTFENTSKDKDYFAYRIEVLFDSENGLPLWMKLYDWEGRPMGIYSYNEFEANVGLNEEFRKKINYHLLKVYSRGDG